MDSGQESARLVNFVEVERRFRRSVNLDQDAGSPAALDGYIVTPAVRRALSQIADGLGEEGGDRAWSLVGPYGRAKAHSPSSWPICCRRAGLRARGRHGSS